MSYLVLARKYRPKTFAEMVGQTHVVQALTNALTTQRLHHAYLFTGTRGVGKTTVSRILAKSLNCLGVDGQGGITAEPCGVCEACQAIDSGRFVDYTELDAASNRGVDEVQQLLEQAVYKPVQGRFKVFMIDEVHMLSNTAFNAMLKTLEEPPEYLKFVLATTDPQKVPVTILSRCLQFNLRPMSPDTVRAHLESILTTENIAYESAALRLLAKSANGSMRDSLSLTDQAIAFTGGVLKEEQVRHMLGAVDDAYIFDLIGCLALGQADQVIETIDRLQHMGLSATATLEQMCGVLHQMMVSLLTKKAKSTDATDQIDQEAQRLLNLVDQMSPEEIQLLYSICLHGQSEIGLANDEYAALTMVLLRLLAFKPPSHIEGSAVAPVKKFDQNPVVIPKNTEQISNSDKSPPPVIQVEAEIAADIVVLGDRWEQHVKQLVNSEAISGLVRELALQAQLIAQNENIWVLRVDSALLNNAGHIEKLQTALQTIVPNLVLQTQFGPVTDSVAKRLTKAQQDLQRQAQNLVLNDHTVQQLMREFGARVVPNSIQITLRTA